MRISSNDAIAIALIDANNFYASCEQTINPHLRNKPVVILSKMTDASLREVLKRGL